MDAVEFIRERNRMCDYYAKNGGLAGCVDCQMYDAVCNSIRAVTDAYIDIVEKWSREHPRKTRQSEFLKQWPEAKKAEDGVLCIRPCFLMADYQKESCKDTYIDEWGSDCYPCVSKFWMQEVD